MKLRLQIAVVQTDAPLGFEPRLAAPKTAVLPLDEGALLLMMTKYPGS